MTDDIDVVVGVVLNGDKFLVEKQGLDEKLDLGVVCLPGGHVRKNEGLEEALKRELHEELRFICENFYVVSNGERQNAYCFLVTGYEGKPVCKSAKEIYWEDKIENLSLGVERKTIMKLRELVR